MRIREPFDAAADAVLETPVGQPGPAGFGSDVVAETLRALDIPYIALNPGASYRGLHDSLVNHLGNAQPQMLLCLHEEHAVAIAHGYAKVTGRAMAAAVHSNVGLMHATMAIFNAWCDRMPVLVIGATGPVDAAKRRPWIDWIHTARDQGAHRARLTSSGTTSRPRRARRARRCCAPPGSPRRAPRGPVYVNLDAEHAGGEARRAAAAARRRALHAAGRAAAPPADGRRRPRRCSRRRKRPVILAGRVSRSMDAWNARVALAEATRRAGRHRPQGRRRLPDRPSAACRRARRVRRCRGAARRIAQADVILSLDWVDLAGTLQACRPGRRGQGDPGLARPHAPQRLEHGPPGLAAGRPAPRRRSRTRGRRRCWPRARRRPRQPDGARRAGAEARPAAARRPSSAWPGPRACARRSATAPVSLPHLPLVLERRVLAVPPSARLSSAPTAAAASAAAPASRSARRSRCEGTGRLPVVDLRRRRLPDGRHRALDRGALPHSAAARRRQQPLLLQRRGAPGARGPHARPPGREQVDRPAHRRSRTSTSPRWRARRAPSASAR